MLVRRVVLEAGGEEPPAPRGTHFEEAIAWHRARVPMAPGAWKGLEADERQHAYAVAGIAQLDLVKDAFKAVEEAVANGTTLGDFKKEIGQKLIDEWEGTVANPGARLENIFRTNVGMAYQAGRYAQASDPAVVAVRPYWKFVAVLDPRTTRFCRPLNGKVVAAGSPWWNTHLPPLHFQCRSTITTLTEEQAQQAGITEKPPELAAQRGFGFAPGTPQAAEGQQALAKQKIDDAPKELRKDAAEKFLDRGGGSGGPPAAGVPGEPPGEGRPDGRKPLGKPVSKALSIEKGASRAESRRAVSAIDRTHGDGVLGRLPVKTSATEDPLGSLELNPATGAPKEILVSRKGDHRAMTACHEIGHLLDRQALGSPGEFASDAHPDLEEWRDAVRATRAFARLEELRTVPAIYNEDVDGNPVKVVIDQEHVEYLLRNYELFARSYAQYIATRTGDALLLEQLNKMRSGGEVVYPKQWADDDFEPVANAIDRLFERKGWLTPKSP